MSFAFERIKVWPTGIDLGGATPLYISIPIGEHLASDWGVTEGGDEVKSPLPGVAWRLEAAAQQGVEAAIGAPPPLAQNARVYKNKPFTSYDAQNQYPATVPSNDLTIHSLTIAGLGTKLNTCGKSPTTTFVHCSNDPGHERYEIRGSSCGDPHCPVCYRTWLNRAADRISCRVQGFQRFARFPPRHIILSASREDFNYDELQRLPAPVVYEKLKKFFRKKSDEVGVQGGVMIIHLWRTTERVPRTTDSKKWDWVRSDGQDSFNLNVELSPHAHIAAYGWLKPLEKGGAFLYKNNGYLIHRDDIQRWAAYTLSHAALVPGKIPYTYEGCCSYRKLKPTWMGRISVELKCPVCGAPMIYEGTHEVAMTRRTIADWVQVQDQDNTKHIATKGPP